MLTIQPLKNFPQIVIDDDLGAIIYNSLVENQIELQSGDIVVVTQKIISKAEDRYVNLADVSPTEATQELAEFAGKDPRLVQVILDESNEVVRKRPGVIITEHRLGFVSANAGVDRSNIPTPDGEELALRLPVNPDDSARQIGEFLTQQCGCDIGILVIDSHGRAWRQGTVGISIGTYHVPELVNKIGDTDMFGHVLKATVIAAADQLAAAAALVMGEADEGTPVAHVRGFPYPLDDDASLNDVLRPKEKDMFR